jgi:hypothetical protein
MMMIENKILVGAAGLAGGDRAAVRLTLWVLDYGILWSIVAEQQTSQGNIEVLREWSLVVHFVGNLVVIAATKEFRKYWSTFCKIMVEQHHGK